MFVGQPFHDFINSTNYNVFGKKSQDINIYCMLYFNFNSESTDLRINKYVFYEQCTTV